MERLSLTHFWFTAENWHRHTITTTREMAPNTRTLVSRVPSAIMRETQGEDLNSQHIQSVRKSKKTSVYICPWTNLNVFP